MAGKPSNAEISQQYADSYNGETFTCILVQNGSELATDVAIATVAGIELSETSYVRVQETLGAGTLDTGNPVKHTASFTASWSVAAGETWNFDHIIVLRNALTTPGDTTGAIAHIIYLTSQTKEGGANGEMAAVLVELGVTA